MSAAPSRLLQRVAWALVIAGAVALAVTFLIGRGALALGALASGWMFAAGTAAGTLALSAAVRIGRGRWANAALPWADAASGFFPSAFLLAVVVALTASRWSPEAAEDVGTWVAARDLAFTAALFAAGHRYSRRPAAKWGVVYLLLYVVTLSAWAVDWILGAKTRAPSAVIPAFYFMGAFLSGIAWMALQAALRGGDVKLRHDLGKLLFGFLTIWAYLLWSAFFPVWYGNLPAETAPLLERWRGGWRFVTLAALVGVFVFPFAFFISRATKRLRGTLAFGSAVVLAGLLLERFVLVLPPLEVPGGAESGVLAACIALGTFGLFLATGTPKPLPAPVPPPP